MHLNSDLIRNELGLRGRYSRQDKELVYDILLDRAREALRAGRQVIVDGTFYKNGLRAPFENLAAECRVPLFWVEVKASEEALRDRLSRPRVDSEADFAVYEKIRDQFEPLTEYRLMLSTDEFSPEQAAEKIRAFIT